MKVKGKATEHETEWLRFITRSDNDPARKTAIVDVVSKSSGGMLGVILWYGPWRQYVFQPQQHTLFNGRCLADIFDAIGRMMRERSFSAGRRFRAPRPAKKKP